MSKIGIDVSEWNTGLDYTTISRQISFVIPRCGYGRANIDKQFLTHVTGFKAAGVDIPAVYHFIYATSVEQAKKNAEAAIGFVQKAKLPKTTRIWCDFEYDTVDKALAQGVTLTKKEVNSFTIAFCETIEAAGYPTGIYANLDYYRNYYYSTTRSRWPIWLADLEGAPNYPCMIQQYSWKGHLDGYAKNFDMDRIIEDDPVTKVTDIAEAEIGYLEKRTNDSLYSKTANAGSANYTKYWAAVKPDYQGQPWCACFVSWVLMKAFGKTEATRLLGHWPFVYCPTLAAKFKLFTAPQVGDVVLFKRYGVWAHTGIVVGVGDGTFTTIEGNTSGGSGVIDNGGGVFKKTYKLSGVTVGFMRPDYDSTSGGGDSKEETYMFEVKTVAVGYKGADVLLCQKLLRVDGFKGKDGKSLVLDGECGTNTVYALKAYQKNNSLTADGICGPKTWAQLLGV